MIAQVWTAFTTVANFAVHTPVILVAGLGLTASLITALIVAEVKVK